MSTAKTPSDKELLAAYNGADKKGKTLLETLYGKEKFAEKTDPIGKGITTFAQVCKALGKTESGYAVPAKGSNQQKADAFMRRLKLIAKCFNGDWLADIANTSQYKYWCWFDSVPDKKKTAGFGFAAADYGYGCANAYVGSRPNFKSSEVCLYVGKTFIAEFEQFAQYQQLADNEI